jgi:hypothetical protein
MEHTCLLTPICLHPSPVQPLAALKLLHAKRLERFRHSLRLGNMRQLLMILTQMFLYHSLWTRFAANRARGEALLSFCSNLPHPQLEGTGIPNLLEAPRLVIAELQPPLPPRVDQSHSPRPLPWEHGPFAQRTALLRRIKGRRQNDRTYYPTQIESNLPRQVQWSTRYQATKKKG